jgi:L-arabinonolactonase
VLQPPPHAILSARNILGEGILWDARRRALWWTDIHGQRLHCHDWQRDDTTCYATPERLSSFGLIKGREPLIAAFASGIGIYDPIGQIVDWLARPKLAPAERFNDGRVDRQGRFWSGTMVEGEHTPAGSLYSIAGADTVRCHLREVSISNGLCFSPDGLRMYFADSPTHLIQVFDVLEPDGLLSAPRPFARTPGGAFPDGATVDADGCVWSAHWGAGCVVRYTPEGRVDRTISVPASQPSCVCFAGTQLDLLCVTTARHGLDEASLDAEPNAGDVFVYRVGVQGLPESEYRA